MNYKIKKSIVIALTIVLGIIAYKPISYAIEENEIKLSGDYVENYSNIELKDSIKKSMYDYVVSGRLGASLGSSYRRTGLTVRDQEKTYLCWAFTMASMLEGTGSGRLYSPAYMAYQVTSLYNRPLGDMANFQLAMNTMANGNGAILEEDLNYYDVYNESKNTVATNYLTPINQLDNGTLNKNIKARITDSRVFSGINKTIDSSGNITYKDGSGNTMDEASALQIRTLIKDHIKNKGPVDTAVYLDLSWDQTGTYVISLHDFYNDNGAYFCNQQLGTTHEVALVGWDDNYAVSNFNSAHQPKNPGAYIALVSYGDTIGADGDKGYLYISYEDVYVESQVRGIESLEEYDYVNNLPPYNKIYQYDEYGYNYAITASSSDGYIDVANVFTRTDSSKTEYIKEAGIYLPITEGVKIFVNAQSDNKDELVEASATVDNINPGYHVIKFSNPIKLTGEKFVICARLINTDGSVIPLEQKSNDTNSLWYNASANASESFVRFPTNGGQYSWQDINGLNVNGTVLSNTNICLKAYTQIDGATQLNNPMYIEDIPTQYTGASINLSNYVKQAQGTVSYRIETNGTTTASTINSSTLTLGAMSSLDDEDQEVVVKITAAGNENYSSVTKTVTIKVKKYERTITLDVPSQMEYDTTATATISMSGSGGTASSVATFNTSNASVIQLTGTTLKAVSGSGTATITVTLPRTTTVKEATAAKTITATKVNITPVVSMSGYRYAGTKSNPSIVGNPGNGEVTYYYSTRNQNTGGTAWSNVTDATSLNAGTYYMYATVAETTNYKSATSTPVEFTITKAKPTVNLSSSTATIKYNAEGTITATVITTTNCVGTITAESNDTNSVTISNIQPANITATNSGVNSTITYKGAGYKTNSTTINIVFTPQNTNYESVEKTFTITSVDKTENTTTFTAVSSLKEGDGKAMITVEGQIGTPYYSVDGEELNSSNYSSNGSTQIPTTNGLTPGTHRIYYYIPAGENYLERKGYIDITIASTSTTGIQYSSADYEGIYDKNAHTIDGPNVTEPSNGIIIYYSTKQPLTADDISTEAKRNSAEASTNKPVMTNAGELTVYWYIKSETSGYTDVSGSNRIKINKATPELTLNSTNVNSVNYNATGTFTATTNIEGTITVTSNDTRYVIIEEGSTNNATPNQAYTIKFKGNEYTNNETVITIRVIPNDTTNYNEQTATFTVKKVNRIVNPTVFRPVNLRVGSNNEMITVENQQGTPYYAIGTELTASNFETAGSTQIPTASGKSAGTYRIYYYIDATGNYSVKSGSIEVTINENTSSEIQYSSQDYNGVYDRNAHTIDGPNVTQPSSGTTIYYSDTKVLTSSNYQTDGSTTKPTRTNAGTTTVFWYIKSTDSSYADKVGSNKIIITKATPQIELTPSSVESAEYNKIETFKVRTDAEGTITVINNENITIEEITKNTNQEYTVKYKGINYTEDQTIISLTFVPTDTENYNQATAELRINRIVRADDPSTSNPVTGVELNPANLTLQVGDKGNFVAKISPVDATNQNVTWSSSDTNIATVSSTGIITAKKEGTATITVTTEDGNHTATARVVVTKKTSSDDDIYNENDNNNNNQGGNGSNNNTINNNTNNRTNTNTISGKNNTISSTNTINSTKKDATTANQAIPKTGKIITFGILGMCIVAICIFIKYKSLKDIK